MTKVIGVKFKTGGRIYYFDPVEHAINPGDGVIVETARGMEFGDVTQGVTDIPESQVIAPLKPVIRVATESDWNMRRTNAAKEGDAFAVCQKKIEQHGLDMKLVDVEYSFNGSKVVFYFTADERVDFRELVKDLAGQFKTRIELRQIGVRDEAKMLGGLGSCGRPVCCKTFLDDFRPVSIKMAKEQNLSLSPTKISGLCGRLMCCLQYEQSGYEYMKKLMPRVNREVLTPDGAGLALENNAITEKTRVKVTMPDGSFDIREYHYTELAKPGDPLPERIQPAPEAQPQPAMAPTPVAQPYPQNKPQPAANAESDKPRRRRRGGRGHSRGNGGQNTGGADHASENNAPAAATQGQRTQKNQQTERKDTTQRQTRQAPQKNGDQAPQNTAAKAQSTGENGEVRKEQNRRRRHRGGANRGNGNANNGRNANGATQANGQSGKTE